MGLYSVGAGNAPGQALRPGFPAVTSPIGNTSQSMGGLIRPSNGMPLGGASPTAAFPRPPTTAPISLGSSSPTLSMTGSIARGSLEANSRKPPVTSLDLLGQEALQTQKQQQKQKQEVNPFVEYTTQNSVPEGSLLSLDEPTNSDNPKPIPPPQPQQVAAPSLPQQIAPPPQPQQVAAPSLPATVSLDDMFVPLDSVLPGRVGVRVIPMIRLTVGYIFL